MAQTPSKNFARECLDFDSQIKSKMEPNDRRKLIDLLERYEESFADEDEELGLCEAAEHSIPLGRKSDPPAALQECMD